MVETIVVCGPSGVGKGTLINKLLADYPSAFGFSVSVTTRDPRPGEVDGSHYHFRTRKRRRRILMGETSSSLPRCTARSTARRRRRSLRSPQPVPCACSISTYRARSRSISCSDGAWWMAGAERAHLTPQVKRSGLDALYVFVAPPSYEGLEKRLCGRGTETEDKIVKRLAGAKRELAFQVNPPPLAPLPRAPSRRRTSRVNLTLSQAYVTG